MSAMKDLLIIAFSETTMALYMERCGKEEGKSGRIIPLPKQMAAGCGLAWATPEREREPWEVWMKAHGIVWETMAEVRL